MFSRMLLLVVLVIGIKCCAVDVPDKLVRAIAQIESHNNDLAVGDKGNAVGRYQIWPVVLTDIHRITGRKIDPDCRTDPTIARYILVTYLRHYGAVYERHTGRRATAEVLARIWNGGPLGWNKPDTIAYWKKIQKYM